MQRYQTKLIRTKNNQLFLFYYEDAGLYFKAYTNDGIQPPKLLLDGVRPCFSLSITPEETPYILVEDQQNRLWLLRKGREEWDKKILLENVPVLDPPAVFYLSLDGEQATLLYNAPDPGEETHSLVYTANFHGKWDAPKRVDTLLPMDACPFQVYDIAERHILVCYLTPEGTIVLREVLLSPFTLGHPAPIIQAGTQCIDLCLLPSPDKIHILYIVKKGNSRQLVYKNKYRTKLSSALLLCEGIKIDNCTLFYGKSILWALWTMNGQLYYATSDDSGNTFSHPHKYRTPPFSSLRKCEYTSYKKMLHSATCAYVTQPDTPVIIPDLSDDFYPPVVASLHAQSMDIDKQLADLQKENKCLYDKIESLEKKIKNAGSPKIHPPDGPRVIRHKAPEDSR